MREKKQNLKWIFENKSVNRSKKHIIARTKSIDCLLKQSNEFAVKSILNGNVNAETSVDTKTKTYPIRRVQRFMAESKHKTLGPHETKTNHHYLRRKKIHATAINDGKMSM